MKLRNALLVSGALATAAFGYFTYNALAQCPGINCVFNQVIAIPVDGIRNTYGSTRQAFAPASSATDIAQLCGSSSKLIRVTKITFGGRATAVTSGDLILVKRSTANTGGTSTTPTKVPYDASAGAAAATFTAYTANPTLGTSLGSVLSQQFTLANLTTGLGNSDIVWTFGDRPATALILRAATQCVSLSLGQATYSGGLVDVSFEWTEE